MAGFMVVSNLVAKLRFYRIDAGFSNGGSAESKDVTGKDENPILIPAQTKNGRADPLPSCTRTDPTYCDLPPS